MGAENEMQDNCTIIDANNNESELEITREFLEEKLRWKFHRISVSPGANQGTTCPLFSVDIWETEATRRPKSLVVKTFPVNPEGQEYLDKAHLFETEVHVYQKVIPELTKFKEQLGQSCTVKMPFAPCLFGNYVQPEARKEEEFQIRENCIIMGDLRKHGNFQLLDKFQGLSLAHMKLVIRAQAQLHAVSWAYRCKTRMGLQRRFFPNKTEPHEDLKAGFDDYNQQCIERGKQILENHPHTFPALDYLSNYCNSIFGLYFDADMGQERLGHTKDSILKTPSSSFRKEEPWQVIVHGDPWCNNMLFRHDPKTGEPTEVRFIDLQMTRVADPLTDVSLALYLNTTKDFRKKHTQTLLQLYYSEFTDICEKFYVPDLPGWSFTELQRRYRRAQIFAGYMALQTLPLQLEESGADQGNDMELTGSGPQKFHHVLVQRMSGVFEDLMGDYVI